MYGTYNFSLKSELGQPYRGTCKSFIEFHDGVTDFEFMHTHTLTHTHTRHTHTYICILFLHLVVVLLIWPLISLISHARTPKRVVFLPFDSLKRSCFVFADFLNLSAVKGEDARIVIKSRRVSNSKIKM